jgi:uncharacterized membrane protein
VNVDLTQRLAGFEGRLRSLEQELAELKRLGVAPEPEQEPEPEPVAVTGTWWQEQEPAPLPAPGPARPPGPPRPPREPLFRAPEVDWADVLGARALAIAGGVVTVLGIVFFFALAVNRGWVGPELRVGLGSLASALVFAGGFELRRRFGRTHASLAAVGAGIAGAYATLLFAAARYDLLPDLAALVLAGGIAAVGVATSLAWSAELVAALGLVGAMLVPAVAVADTGVTRVGTGFVAVVLAAAGAVALRRRWTWLLVASAAASLPQIAVLVAEGDRGDAGAVTLAAAFVALYALLGVGRQLGADARLDPFGASFVTGAAGLVAVSSLHLLDHTARGIALLVVAAAYGAGAAVFFRTRRDLSSLLWAAGLILAAGAAEGLLSGLGLATVWAAQGAVLAWLAARSGEPRFRLGSIGYLGLAAAHALLLEAPVRELFNPTVDPASGAPALLAVAAGLVVLAVYAAGDVRRGAALGAVLFAADAASLGVLDLVQSQSTFDWGEVAVTGLWALLALAALVLGLRLERSLLALGGLLALGAPVAKAVVFDPSLVEPERWYGLVAAGAATVAGGFLYQLLERRLQTLDLPGLLLHGVGLGLAAGGVVELLGDDRLGSSLGLVAAVYALLAASVVPFARQRDHATLLGAVALAFAACAAAESLDGTTLVLSWAALAVGPALAARPLREPRFLVAIVAGLVLARSARGELPRRAATRSAAYEDLVSAFRELELRSRIPALWTAGVLGLYALSLAVLELFERVSPGDVHARFQRGHTAVSACWALVALGLLYAGLTRRARPLRVGGLALFGAALAKLFLYDLATLSSITRALSFLAVGALLLVAGFFYQRLSEQLSLRDGGPVTS